MDIKATQEGKMEKEEIQKGNTKFVDEFAEEIYNQTYRYGDEDINDTQLRVAKNIASVENDKNYWTKQFLYALEDFKFVPGGRITSNAGTGLGGTTYINCFTPETEVLTKSGYKKIEDIKINDSVLTHKGRWRNVKSLIKREYNGVLDVYESNALTSNIKSTPEHPFYQGNGEWVNSKDNKQLTLLNYDDCNVELQTIDLYEYVKDIKCNNNKIEIFYNGDIIHTTSKHDFHNGSVSTRTSAELNRKIMVTDKLAYVFGRFVGDGSTFNINNDYEVDGFNIIFNTKEWSELLEVKETIENSFGLEINVNESKNFNGVYLRKNNILLAEFFKNAFGRYSDSKKIPDFIWNSPKNIIESFLLGLYDSDGMVTSSRMLRIVLNNYKLVKDIQALMNMIGYPCRITETSTGKHTSWKLQTNKNIAKHFIEKMKKYYTDGRLENIKVTNNGLSPIIDISTKNEKIHIVNKFQKTEENYDGFVYNISVDEDESYVVNNVVVHNCFVSGFQGEDQDSMEGILDELRRQALILKSEGGYGFCADVMRPRGAFINGIGNESPGAVKMLDMWDTQSAVITEGSGRKSTKGKVKIRKGAQMVTMSCHHPDIVEFITAKQTPGRLTKFNMSILVSDEFMEAVNKHKPWNLEFPDYDVCSDIYKKEWDGNLNKWKSNNYPTKIYKTYEDANELYDLIMESTYNRNEPGILFYDTINKMNNLYYTEHISATNPCVVGDTKVYVADGRGYVPIKELAESNKDIPVFCLNDNGKLVVRTMRNPRITGYDEPIYKVTIEDGYVFRVTGNHKFRLKDGSYKEAKHLTNGDSLYMLSAFEATIKDIFPNANSKSQDYIWIREGGKTTAKSEHRLIAEFHNNTEIPSGYVVHHKDYNGQNNRPENLQIMSSADHRELHRKDMLGDKNPMRRAEHEWSEEKWAEYRENMSNATSGEKNGRYSGITEDDFRNLALELTSKLGRRFSLAEWEKFCEENGKKYTYTKWRERKLGTIKGIGKWAALKLGFDKYSDFDPRMVRNFEHWTALGYNCRIETGGLIFIKECEQCHEEFETLNREHSMCGLGCVGKANSSRNRTPEFIAKCTEAQRKLKAVYKEEMRELQMKIYSDLKFDLKREPFRVEWENKCKELETPFRVGKSSPFKNFGDLKENAVNYNHKVISIEADGYENVYNGTVDDFHNFFIGGFEVKMKNGKRNYLSINNLQCGEQLLPTGGVCLLGSLNLTQFVDSENRDWNYKELKKVIPIAIRFMDNVNDITNVPLTEQKLSLKSKRRIGLGIMGYGSALMMMKLKYGSNKAIEISDKLMKFIMNEAYMASSIIASEKGSFLEYDEDKYLAGNFIKTLDESTINSIKKNGIRNSHLLSIQPTGNCVRKNTKIKTDQGIISMNDIFKLNNIDINKDDKNKWYIPTININVETITGENRITGLYINDRKDILSIGTDNNNKIEGTFEHKVLVRINEKEAIWKYLKDIKIGDKILFKK